jgi:RimJ/RimL family protein N-acetyltransferase
MKLITKRLILRELTIEDAKDLVKQMNNINISKWLLVVPYPYTMKDAKWYINNCKEKKKKPITSYSFNMELKEKQGIIGGLGLSHVNREQGKADIGYWIGEDYWRKGYTSEGVERLIGYAFNTLKLRRLTISAFKENKASNGLAKNLGFKYEGTLRQSVKCKATGKIHDENVWNLLKSEYKK